MPLRLTVLPNDGAPWHRTLWEEDGPYSIGRGPDNAIQIDDPQISRRHAVVRYETERWEIRDSGSANGISVDGLRIESADLNDGTEVRFGTLGTLIRLVTSAELDRAERERLQTFQTSLRDVQFGRAGESSELLDRLLKTCAQVCGASRGFVLIGDSVDSLEMHASLNMESNELTDDEFSGSRGAVQRVLETGLPVVVADASNDAGFAKRASIESAGIRCLICLPLTRESDKQGVVYLDSREPGKIFDNLDVQFLESIAGHASLALEVERLRGHLESVRTKINESSPTVVKRLDELPIPASVAEASSSKPPSSSSE